MQCKKLHSDFCLGCLVLDDGLIPLLDECSCPIWFSKRTDLPVQRMWLPGPIAALARFRLAGQRQL